MTVLVLKRTGDKLDAVLTSLVLMLGVLVLGVYMSAPRLTCVPLACVDRPYSTHCARDWLYLRYGYEGSQISFLVRLSSQCEATFLSYPDTNLHFLLLATAGLAFCLLGSPIFYGNSVCAELFNNFSSVWKLRNNDPVTKVRGGGMGHGSTSTLVVTPKDSSTRP